MSAPSLTAQFEALHAERERSWSPEQLARNIAQRETLVQRYDPSSHIGVGDPLPAFELLDVDGGTIDRHALLAKGPAVLIFFRYAGCPACNIALPHYDKTLWPALRERGIRLVAISPHEPKGLAEIKTRHNLGFTVASDPDNRLGRALGVTFEPDEKPEVKPGESWIGSIIGTNSWELPQPTVLIVDQDARVRYVDVSPDWLRRTESETILDHLPENRAAA